MQFYDDLMVFSPFITNWAHCRLQNDPVIVW